MSGETNLGDCEEHEMLIADVAHVLDLDRALSSMTHNDDDPGCAHGALVSEVATAIDLDRVLEKVVSAAAVTDRAVSGGANPRTRTGTVTEFDQNRGCGYIRPDGGGEQIYFSLSDAHGSLRVGQRVTFEDKPSKDLDRPVRDVDGPRSKAVPGQFTEWTI